MSSGATVAVVDCGPTDEPLLARLRAGAETEIHGGAPDAGAVVERARGCRVLATLYTYTEIGEDVVGPLTPGLELIATRTAGHTHIDVEAAARHGVAVATVPGASTQAVAEYVFGALLAAQRRLFEAADAADAGRWDYQADGGFELAGSTLGVVGLGATGRAVAGLGRALGMDVLGWSRSARQVDGVRPASLESLLQRADVVSIHVPLDDDTRGLIGADELDLLRQGSWLVNSARGGVVDEHALVERLRERRIGGAVLDVLDPEPPTTGRLEELRDVPNLLVTPHIAWNTVEALHRQFDGLTDNILAFLSGQPRNLVPVETARRKET